MQRTLAAQLGRRENANFLEQFRYIIVASQLLSVQASASQYHTLCDLSRAGSSPNAHAQAGTAISLQGAAVTGATAFLSVWLLYWVRAGASTASSVGRTVFALLLMSVMGVVSYAYVRRQWLQYLRRQAIDATTAFVGKSQALDAAASATINLIQEVELVSRGYRM